MRGPLRMTAEEAKRRLKQAVAESDLVRASHLRFAGTLQKAKQVSLRVERSRLAAKYGAHSDRVAVTEARTAAGADLEAFLSAEVDRVMLQPPEVDARTFVTYGQVLDPSRAPLRGLVVAAVDEAGEEVKRTRTDRHGHFELRLRALPPKEVIVTPSTQEGPVQQEPELSAEERRKRPGRRAARAAAEAPNRVRLLVSSPDEMPIYRSREMLTVAPGRAAYREVIVEPEESKKPKTTRGRRGTHTETRGRRRTSG